MSSETTSPIPQTTIRNLSDKLQEKRKQGASEIEALIKQLRANRDEKGIRAVILSLTTQFVFSIQANWRKGGLFAIAAVAVGLSKDIQTFLQDIVPPVLKCLNDQDAKVRYHAFESLYNIAKVARGGMLQFFPEVFDGLCKLCADADPGVKSAAELLDRLMKDIVTESDTFQVPDFVNLIRERIATNNPHVRQFLVSWIAVLDSVPEINLLDYLPQFLDGLFQILSDPSPEIRRSAHAALSEFLAEIQRAATAEYGPIVDITIRHCSSPDDFTRMTALHWVHGFLVKGKERLLPYNAALLGAVLPCISHKDENVRSVAGKANEEIQRLLQNTQQNIEFGNIIKVLESELVKQFVPTRMAALHWIYMLFNKASDSVLAHLDELFPLLLKTLSDPSEEVVSLDLEVMARLSSTEDNFRLFMRNLVKLFGNDPKMLSKAGLIVRQLALMLSPEKIFRALAKILETEEDTLFASVMIQTLNMILLTSNELAELRSLVRCSRTRPEGRDLFIALYPSWCHNPVATLSLCLLGQAYEHAAALVAAFGEIEITVSFLVQVDKLVQLLESPIFAHTRLQLLEPQKHPHLLKALYGLLMVLPQSSAYDTLKNRLKSVSTMALLHVIETQQWQLLQQQSTATSSSSTSADGEAASAIIDYKPLLEQFWSVQKMHSRGKS